MPSWWDARPLPPEWGVDADEWAAEGKSAWVAGSRQQPQPASSRAQLRSLVDFSGNTLASVRDPWHATRGPKGDAMQTTEPTSVELESWIWERRGIVPDLKLYMLALLKEHDPESAGHLAGLKPGQSILFRDMLLAAGWASRSNGGIKLELPPAESADAAATGI